MPRVLVASYTATKCFKSCEAVQWSATFCRCMREWLITLTVVHNDAVYLNDWDVFKSA